MPSIDWRSPAAYEDTKNISAAGFAWEYLRRNEEYRRDYQKTAPGKNPGARQSDVITRRWGLRFPVRSRHAA